MEKILIRDLEEKDIEAVLGIDRKITGSPNPEYWRDKAITYLGRGGGACLAAEIEGRLVGFVLGDIRGWEFGVPLSGWLEIVGVDPDYQGKGVGRRLVDALGQRFLAAGVDTVHTMVDWNASDLVGYFISMGFKRAEYILMERKLKGGGTA